MLTRSQINRAGRRLRKAETPDEADRQIYDEFRATFAEPLAEVVEALRGVAGGAPVTYRLKRFETTVEKLRRLTSDLARLEDIAGCRVVVPTMREQRDILGLIRQEFKIIRERDYQAEPRDGYRALHVVVHSQGKAVEVQIRTELEEQWANAAERLADKLDPAIKYGSGPRGAHDILDAASRICGRLDAAEEKRHQYRDTLRALHGDSAREHLLDYVRLWDDEPPDWLMALDRFDVDLQAARDAVSEWLGELESSDPDQESTLLQLAEVVLATTLQALDEAIRSVERSITNLRTIATMGSSDE